MKAPRIFRYDAAGSQVYREAGPVIEARLTSDRPELADRRLTLELTYDDARRMIADLTRWLTYDGRHRPDGSLRATAGERHDYEPATACHPTQTDPLCSVCGEPARSAGHAAEPAQPSGQDAPTPDRFGTVPLF